MMTNRNFHLSTDDEERSRRLLSRHIPIVYVERLIRPEELVRTHALTEVQRWLADSAARRLLVLAGPGDSGKTLAAAAAAAADPNEADQRWLRNDASLGRFISAGFLLDAWTHQVAWNGASGARRNNDPLSGMNKDELVSCSLLVIDDLGEEDSVRMQQTLEVVDIVTRLRCDELLRTVITTNMANMAALVSRYRDTERAHRLAERMTKHGAWVDCPVEGLRRQGAIEIRPNTCLGGPPQDDALTAAMAGARDAIEAKGWASAGRHKPSEGGS